jgi:iron complex outermembrane receptor protein
MLGLLLASLLTAFVPQGQSSIRVEVRADGLPAPGASVRIGNATHTTDAAGLVTVAAAPGVVTVTVDLAGFVRASRDVSVPPSGETQVIVDLQAEPIVEEEVTVLATRTDRRLDDQPLRVEVLQREEIEEKMLMTPGDIVMMLNEMGGMRVQATSPSLGAASVRVQGMRGRYTRYLSDGLPLFGEQPGGLGLLQIPPMDLGQVEVIKGVASALYGGGAMGGVVNLVSRRARAEPDREILLNQSTRGATDAVLWWSAPLGGGWAWSLLAGTHRQSQDDVDGDGWSDLPGYGRAVARPRIYWTDDRGGSFFATAGVTWEDREGGTVDDAALAATGAPYVEQLDTLRVDAGAIGQTLIAGRFVLTARGAASRQRHTHGFGLEQERDRHRTLFGEVALRGTAGRHTWVAGSAIEHDAYSPLDVPAFAYTYTVPGFFVQDDLDLPGGVSLSASGRVDRHSEYGWFFSPRLSLLYRTGGWAARLSGGTGFFGPTALTEETEAAGLRNLRIPRALRAERGRGASFDVTRTAGPVSATVTLFGSRVIDPVHVTREAAYTLTNLDAPTETAGVEALGTFRRAPFALTANYAYVRAREQAGTVREDVPLTPRHSAGFVGMLESEETGRLGLEVYYTGRQRLDANPYADESRAYVIVGLLAERRFGRLRIFVNGENLTGVRQTRWDPLLRPSPAADGRWTVDAWAPLEGRTINGGVRVVF